MCSIEGSVSCEMKVKKKVPSLRNMRHKIVEKGNNRFFPGIKIRLVKLKVRCVFLRKHHKIKPVYISDYF